MGEDKSLFFLTISLTCIWVVLDNIWGKKYLSNLLDQMFNGASDGSGGVASIGGGSGYSGGGSGGGTRSDSASNAGDVSGGSSGGGTRGDSNVSNDESDKIYSTPAKALNYTCSWCGKKFETATALATHMVNCTPASGLVDRFKNEEPMTNNETVAKAMNYTCSWCGKKFTNADDLVNHQAGCTPGGAIVDKVIGFITGGN